MDAQEHYEAIAKMYNESAKAWDRDKSMTESDRVVKPAMIAIAAGGRDLQGKALDVGCGEGFFTRMLAPHMDYVHAVDLSENLISIARRKDAERPRNIEYHVGNMVNLCFLRDDLFVLATSAFSYHYVPFEHTGLFFKELNRVLQKAGRVVIGGVDAWVRWDYEKEVDPSRTSTYYGDEGKVFRQVLEGADGRKMPVMYVHRTEETNQRAMLNSGFDMEQTILLPGTVYSIDGRKKPTFRIYELRKR